MDQLPRLGKRELICLLLFTCNYVVFVWRGLLFLWVLGMGYVILLWHSLSLPYNYFAKPSVTLPILVEEYQIMVNRPFNICFVIFRFNMDGFKHNWDNPRHLPFNKRLTKSYITKSVFTVSFRECRKMQTRNRVKIPCPR